jgi:prepilin-type N-terminal cleavage/methylation domain-containing protein
MRTGGNQSAGFTIVETLIVLAVSSVLAASSLLLINGKQNRTEFQVAANNLKQQFEQLINETANGYYPTRGDFYCDGAGGTPVIKADSNNKQQGTNNSCIFLGKALAFGIPDSGKESFTVYPLVAKRNTLAGSDVSSFVEAKPIALASDGSSTYPAAADYGIKYQTRSGLKLNYARYVVKTGPTTKTTIGGPGKTSAVLVFANSLGQYSDTQTSSVQKLELYDYDLVSTWVNPATGVQTVQRINSGTIDEANDILEAQLCFTSGGSNQSVLMSISGHGQLAVTTQIYGNKDCT